MIKNTQFYNYIKDRQSADIIEDESGFIIYKISGKECFIMEMYTDDAVRSTGKGHLKIIQLKKIAQEAGCAAMSANIHLWDKRASQTLIAALKVGFEIARAENNVILIVKDIQGG